MFQTDHRFLTADAREIPLEEQSVHLVVTSPPYPVIEMWDDLFGFMDPAVPGLLDSGRGREAFEAMHRQMDRVWSECNRVLVPGGFLCINIGDAVRTLGTDFQLYSNHSRIISSCIGLGFNPLPLILWRKPANSPTKFMGSGMFPAGAYVTLEHEYILVFRKGGKRVFSRPEDKKRRRRSGFFWEERNRWFSDLWDFTGVRQKMEHPELRARSAAFPLELPRRLVAMYSLQEDLVLDPFAGTGTTLRAAMESGRSSVGLDLMTPFRAAVHEGWAQPAFTEVLNEPAGRRLEDHRVWAAERVSSGREPKYRNSHYGFPVMTRQEVDLALPLAENVVISPAGLTVTHGFSLQQFQF